MTVDSALFQRAVDVCDANGSAQRKLRIDFDNCVYSRVKEANIDNSL